MATKKQTTKNVKETIVAPDYQIALAKGELLVNLVIKNEEYDFSVNGLKTIKTLSDLIKFQELLDTVIENTIALEPDYDCEECFGDTCDYDDLGPCPTCGCCG